MRVFRVRTAAAASSSSAATAFSSRVLRRRSALHNAAGVHGILHHHANSISSNNIKNRHFSFKFPTQDEAATLAHADDDHDPNRSQLVCGSCNTPISQTKDLIFFKWCVCVFHIGIGGDLTWVAHTLVVFLCPHAMCRKNGIHLSSMTDAPLRNLCSQDNWDDDVSWKKHKLHCLKCDHHVGTMAKVFTSDKILFSAKQVAIQMPAHQSPLISISGYPSSQLGFSYWTELILMLETQPTLKDALQIRRVHTLLSFVSFRCVYACV